VPRAPGNLDPVETVSELVPASYRVAKDGTIGCAEAHALRILRSLRETGGASPRLMAQAHREGGCMTVYRINKWIIEQNDGDIVKLRLAESGSIEKMIILHFFFNEVELRN
jgi:hypothetical protein